MGFELDRRLRSTVFLIRQWAHPFPDVLIIGAQKGGTTSLYRWLVQHPAVRGGRRKELHFFNRNYALGPAWYRCQFPMGSRYRRWLAIESTPGYLTDPRVPQRVKQTMGRRRFIVLLRNPVSRAYSHYHHTVRLDREHRSFSEVVADEIAGFSKLDRITYPIPMNHGYLYRGLYADWLAFWFDHFERDDFLVLKSETMFADPQQAYEKVLRFLSLQPTGSLSFAPFNIGSGTEPNIGATTLNRLDAFYAEPNRRLFDMLGNEFTPDW